jgi:glycosyltransferase EpsD
MFPKNVVGARAKIFRFCEKLLRKKTDHIMVMNAQDLEIANEYKLCRGEVRMTLGMGARVVPAPTVETDLILKHNKGEGKYILCFVGELYKAKNQRMLICALPEIKMAIPNAVLWLVGEGVARGELVALAEQLNISDSVYFMGQRDNPCDYIRAADVYVSASEKEGLPFNILEALGCGKTVVASRVKGQEDIIEDGVSGFLYPFGDFNAFAELVKRIHSGELSIDPRSAVARFERYSFNNVFHDTYGTMKELMEK